MEESKQQEQQNQFFLQMQHQQQMQQRQQQFLLMQQLQNQQQQQQSAAMSRFPASFDSHLRPTGFIQTRPVNPNPFQQQNVTNQQMMMMQQLQQQQQQKSMMMMQQQQQQFQKPTNRPVNQSEIQFAYQDSWRVCHPDFKRPFVSLEDACERLLPYHVVADYEAEEDDRILLEADATSLPRSQQWDNNIAGKVAEFTATFEKQVQAFNLITEKRRDGELRAEERLMIEQALLQDERKACTEVKSELDREMKAQEARLRMAALAGQVRTESQQQSEMMARNPLRANAIRNHGEQGRSGNMNPDEMMMMMNGWGSNGNNNNNSVVQREEKEPLEDFLNDEENENGEHENWRGNADFDLNTR